MMIKSSLINFLLILFLTTGIKSFNIDEYVASIGELFTDITFVEEYEKWAFKLFSDPNYMYGKPQGPFPCATTSSRDPNDPITVHSLRPQDVQCVGAIGDSITAALGAHAGTPIGLVTENRGIAWSIGGALEFETSLTLPNILRKYNPNLQGFSTKNSLIFGKGQNSSHNALNCAKSGSEAHNMPDQSHILEERVLSKDYCDMENDWKVITLFIGGNDLCVFCNEPNAHTPDNYTSYVTETLDYLHANYRRTFVNLVLVLDVRSVEILNAGGLVCSLMHQKTCPCAAYPPSEDARKLLDEYIPQYQSRLVELVNSGRYDTRDDFTVVVQPFLAHTDLPRKQDGTPEYKYFAPDCFHFSGEGHTRAALALWNNMLEPVGQKQWSWHEGETIECPTAERPYFATRKNSPQSSEIIPPRIFKK